MTNDEQVTTVMDQLSTAYSEPELKQFPQLRNAILQSAEKLSKTNDVKLVASLTCRKITLAYAGNKTTFPKSAEQLFKQLQYLASDYTGDGSYHRIMPNWFE